MTTAADSQPSRGEQLSHFISQAAQLAIPDAVRLEAKRALIDYLGVAIGAVNDDAVRAVRQVAKRWNASGESRVILGGTTTPALAALINATMAHAADYDDTHPAGLPRWRWRRRTKPTNRPR